MRVHDPPILCSEPVLQYPDFSKPFNITTDASGCAVGAVLSQGEIGKDRPIAYASRLLQGAELNYSTIEKECLAIVYAVRHFQLYVWAPVHPRHRSSSADLDEFSERSHIVPSAMALETRRIRLSDRL